MNVLPAFIPVYQTLLEHFGEQRANSFYSIFLTFWMKVDSTKQPQYLHILFSEVVPSMATNLTSPLTAYAFHRLAVAVQLEAGLFGLILQANAQFFKNNRPEPKTTVKKRKPKKGAWGNIPQTFTHEEVLEIINGQVANPKLANINLLPTGVGTLGEIYSVVRAKKKKEMDLVKFIWKEKQGSIYESEIEKLEEQGSMARTWLWGRYLSGEMYQHGWIISTDLFKLSETEQDTLFRLYPAHFWDGIEPDPKLPKWKEFWKNSDPKKRYK